MKGNKTPSSLYGALGAAIFASACCTVPLIMVTAGISGAWISTLTELQPFRPLFIVISLGLIAIAFYRRATFKGRNDCDCTEDGKRRSTPAMLLLALVSVGLIASPLFLSDMVNGDEASNTIVVRDSDIATSVLAIDGMTCATCTVTVEKALSRLPGVVAFEVTYEPQQATVEYDSSRLSEMDLVQAIRNVGYRSNVDVGSK